jgi:hemin uptake protein HemP
MNARPDQEKSDPAAAERPVFAVRERSICIADNRMDSQELFAGTREITIAHGTEVYRLRLTAQNKLILTK